MAGEDPKHLAALRQMACAACFSRVNVTAHHHTGGRGLSQRSHDHRAFPLCFVCHDDFHQARGIFFSMTKDQRRDWQDAQAERYRPKQFSEVF